jgi:hypothetical protein
MSPVVNTVTIVGAGRSGSTLLDTVLGAVDGWFSTGELRDLWQRGLVEGRRCGCGSKIIDCEVWGRVLDEPSGRGDRLLDRPVEQVLTWQRRYGRTRHTRRLLGPGTPEPDVAAYLATMDLLYTRIHEVTGAKVVVDSSKRPSDAALASRLPSVDARAVHLVRDPRAVTFSWSRTKPELDADAPAPMPNRGVLLSIRVWNELNLVAELVHRRLGADRMTRVRYEDLVADPRRVVAEVLSLVPGPSQNPVGADATIDLGTNHTVGGNPRRFQRGPTRIAADDEWRTTLAPIDRALCSALTLPLRHRYGYTGMSSSRRAPSAEDARL